MGWQDKVLGWDWRLGIPDFVGKAAHCEPLPVALEFLENLRRPPFQRQRPRKQALACHRLQHAPGVSSKTGSASAPSSTDMGATAAAAASCLERGRR
jgi:hypothetical protein